ncbi:MAG: alanine racemase [Alphaproteobacteria bacterium]
MNQLARPLWAEIDLGAITHNVTALRERAGRPVKLLMPVKANAYGQGVVEVSRHLESLGVDGLATANVDDALAARAAGVELPILIYGAQLPGGNAFLLEHRLTPTIYDRGGLDAVAKLATDRPVDVHVKVDAGLGRLGVRLDQAAGFIAAVVATPGLNLEGLYTHIPYGSVAGEDWCRRRLADFCALVEQVEHDHGIDIRYAQAAASSILTGGLPDRLNTISPGHLTYGLSPVDGIDAEAMGFRKALKSLRARLIHVGRRTPGDDLPGGWDRDTPTGVIVFGMDNGYRPAAPGQQATMLCHGQRCPVLGVSAEYSVIDLSAVPDAVVGDLVTVVGEDGDERITAEQVAADLGAPSAAYWMVALKNIPMRYRG